MATSTDLRAAIEEVQEQLPPDQLEGELDDVYSPDMATRIERRIGALPWWVISAVIHSVIFLLATLIGVAVPPPETDEVTIMSDVAKKKEPEYEKMKKRDVFKSTHEVEADTKVENPVVVHEKAEVSDHFETENDVDTQSARGNEDAISDIPLGGTGVVGSMGVGGGGMAGVFGYREGGGKRKAVARFGGSKATESAVEAALRWLARHQEADGHWDPTKWDKGAGPVGMTGLALLAFLGAGHTEKAGKFRDNVRRAQQWLIAHPEKMRKKYPWEKRGKGDYRCSLYEQGMAGLALAEAFGMSRNKEVGKAAQDAIDYILKAQGPYEAWNYHSKKGKAGRNDTSVSGWNLMALKSAKIAGLKVDHAGFQGCMRWLEAATRRSDGRCAYAGTVTAARKGNGSMAMCAAGVLMRQFMGVQRDDPILQKAAVTMGKHQPIWEAGNPRSVNFYYWYYGTLCMFQMGGKHWTQWNKNMKKSLVDNQRKGGPMDGSANDVDGSWDPIGGGHVPRGGRVFSTALGALSLEVYYRYLPVYGK
jgi:hypothetical protein